MSGEIVIRETVPADLAAIVEVHKKGFGYDKEAGLTAELLSDPTAGPAFTGAAMMTVSVSTLPRMPGT